MSHMPLSFLLFLARSRLRRTRRAALGQGGATLRAAVTAMVVLTVLPVMSRPVGQQFGAAERFRASGALQLLDKFVAQQMQEDRTPGIALAVTSRDGLLMTSAYGFADLRAKVPLTPAHLFEIGSISTAFTAIALLQQRDGGRFNPDANIMTYLPWFSIRSEYEPLTGHHLLTHTAGLPRDRDDIPSSLYQAVPPRDQFAESRPGTRYAYSNVAYQVLGYALAAIAGRPYADVIRDGVLRPLGMNGSEARFTHDTRLRLAVGYEPMYDDRPPHVSHPLVQASWFEYAAGDASIVSNPEDMAAFVSMLLNRGRGPAGPLISTTSFELLTQKGVTLAEQEWFGYGLRIREIGRRTLLSNSGSIAGYDATLVADMTDGIGVVVLTNGPASVDAIADFVLETSRAVRAGAALPALPAPRDRLAVPDAAHYAGEYKSGSDVAIRFVAENERLWLIHQGARVPLEPRGPDRFYANHPDFALFLMQFSRDAARRVTELGYGDEWFAGKHYSGPRTFRHPDEWDAFRGHYRAAHARLSNFRVVVRKDQLRLVTPEGLEHLLVPLSDEAFALDEKSSPERLRFDTIVNGSALRAMLSGVAYYRTFTP
jgi:D-alanyl-D-alanine carboxypeptidase